MAIEFRETRDLVPNEATKRHVLRDVANFRLIAPRAGLHERMIFTEQLALLLETGVSIHEALRALKQQSQNPALTEILGSLLDTVAEGKPLSVALSRHAQMFPPSYVSLVAAAEEGGFLQHVLQQLLEVDEKNSQLRRVIVSALSYPAFLVAFSLAVVVFVLLVIFPKFEELFESIRDQLPWTTVALMAASDFLRKHWVVSLVMLAGVIAGAATWFSTPAGVRTIDRWKLRLPGLRDIFIQVYLNQSLNVIGLALVSGVPITIAIRAAQDVVRNRLFAEFLETVRQEVTNGRGVAYGFGQGAFVPAMVREMIATGERSGNLGKVMLRVAEFYSRELSKRIALLAKIAEPFMLMVMGAVVGLLVASLILPIFKLSKAIH